MTRSTSRIVRRSFVYLRLRDEGDDQRHGRESHRIHRFDHAVGDPVIMRHLDKRGIGTPRQDGSPRPECCIRGKAGCA
jgi:hypothetical protein